VTERSEGNRKDDVAVREGERVGFPDGLRQPIGAGNQLLVLDAEVGEDDAGDVRVGLDLIRIEDQQSLVRTEVQAAVRSACGSAVVEVVRWEAVADVVVADVSGARIERRQSAPGADPEAAAL